MAMQFRCEADGKTIRGADADELVKNVEEHLRTNHPDLVGKLSTDEILAAAQDVA